MRIGSIARSIGVPSQRGVNVPTARKNSARSETRGSTFAWWHAYNPKRSGASCLNTIRLQPEPGMRRSVLCLHHTHHHLSRATLSPNDFVAKWRGDTLKERSVAQEHFIDLCRLLGHPTPAEATATGSASPSRRAPSKQQRRRGLGRRLEAAATSPGSTRASTRTSTRPTSSCCSTARSWRTRRCWWSAT